MLENTRKSSPFIGRQAELAWLDKGQRLHNLMLLKGLRGVGKSTLAQKWLQSHHWKSLWITCENFRDLPHQLGYPQASAESALELAAQNWQQVDAVVWDDLHLLPPAQRQILLSFLSKSIDGPICLLLSDEEIAEADRAEIAQYKLSAFLPEETKLFLQAIGENPTDEMLEKLQRNTGGLPLLLRLTLQNPNLQPQEIQSSRLLQDLSKPGKNLIEQMQIFAHTLTPKMIEGLQISPETLQELNKKCLLEEVPGDVGSYKIPTYVQSIVANTIKADQRRDLALQILGWKKFTDLAKIDLLRLALISKNESALSEAVDPAIIAQLEQLHREDQAEIFRLLLDLPPNLPPLLSINSERFIAKLQFLVGNRMEALSRIESIALNILTQKEPPALGAQNLLLEYVQLLNRLGESTKARSASSRIQPMLNEQLSALLHVEQAVSWLPGEPATAASILEKILENPQMDNLAKANAQFQMGRAKDLLQDFAAAKNHYSIALQYFTSLQRNYHAAVCRLNLTWIALKNRDWHSLSAHKKILQDETAKYGYHYALAGLELMEATEAREFLAYNKALAKSDSSLRRLGKNAPLANILDAQIEKIRALLALNLREQARLCLDEISANSQMKEKFAARLQGISWLISESICGSEEWLEQWEKLPQKEFWQEDIWLHRARFCLWDSSQSMPQSPLFHLAQQEMQLLQALQGSDQDEIWPLIRKWENILQTSDEAMLEKTACLLLQYSITAASAQKQSLLERAKLELERVVGNAESKFPLQAWLESLEQGDSPLDHPLWKKSQQGDRERWQLWQYNSQKKPRHEWILTSSIGRREADEYQSAAKDIELFFLAPMAELRWRGKSILQLQRRHSLRLLLTYLLENSPEAADKESITRNVWKEEYNPATHDPRIYTSIQRLRELFRRADCIQNWQGSYRWNPTIPFLLVQKNMQQDSGETKLQSQLLQALQNKNTMLSRSELVRLTQTPEATVKRSLARLLSQGRIRRIGKGRSICYRINN